jgi:Family of unknown function (DUF6084)
VSETLVAPDFEVLSAEAVRHSAAPAMRFVLKVTDGSGASVAGIVLSAQVQIDPARRRYDDATREKLVELFGAPERWASTTRSFLWTQVGARVQPFQGQAVFDLLVPATYDLEVAAAKYVYSLPDGEVPLSLHFSGTVFYESGDGRLQLTMVPWSCSAKFGLPVETWRAMMAEHYPGGGWVRLETETLDRLAEHKAREGLPSFDATLRSLLD